MIQGVIILALAVVVGALWFRVGTISRRQDISELDIGALKREADNVRSDGK